MAKLDIPTFGNKDLLADYLKSVLKANADLLTVNAYGTVEDGIDCLYSDDSDPEYESSDYEDSGC